jgi:hypothetical protein
MKNAFMKTAFSEIALNRWPYGLELQPSANGLLLRPRRKARANWNKIFRRPRSAQDDLAATRRLANEFDSKEWQW